MWDDVRDLLVTFARFEGERNIAEYDSWREMPQQSRHEPTRRYGLGIAWEGAGAHF